jgi:hypothetical protein
VVYEVDVEYSFFWRNYERKVSAQAGIRKINKSVRLKKLKVLIADGFYDDIWSFCLT